MDIVETLVGTAAGMFSPNIVEKIENIKGQHDDVELAEDIQAWFLNEYGNELFYNDLDAFLSKNNAITNLITGIRNPAQQQIMGPAEFIDKTLESFLKDYPNHRVQKSEIKDILIQIYSFVLKAITNINRYSDVGKLQSDFRVAHADTAYQLQEMRTQLGAILSTVQAGPTAVMVQTLPDCTAEVDRFQAEIERVAKDYQSKKQFDVALAQYSNISLSIAEAGIHGEPKDTLICSLRCNIALCHSNLGDLENALDDLAQIPTTIAQSNATYNFVRAAILVQHNCDKQYSEALTCAEKALELKSDYHQAFLLRQHLRALTGNGSQQGIIADLDAYFSGISDEKQRDALTANYYACRGLICSVFNDPYGAFDNYELAAKHGYDELIAQYNMLSALYGQAVQTSQQGQWVLPQNVDTKKLYDILAGLKKLLQDERLDAKSYYDVKCQAIRLYVGTSSALKGSHDLKPVQVYLPFAHDYETIRMLILGSKEPPEPDIIYLLNEDDRFLLQIRQLFDENNPQKCKEEIEQHLEIPGYTLPTPIMHMLLQLCLITKDPQSYRKYRESADGELFSEGMLVAMDACAYELEGDIITAKELFDSVSHTHTDYHILGNALHFYKRNDYICECEALFLKLQSLQNEQKTYVDDIDNFYCEGIHFLTTQKCSSAEIFLANAPLSELSSNTCAYMKALFYSANNDIARLSETIPYPGHTNFQNGINQALCHRYMLQYDEGLKLCLDLVEHADETNKDELVKLYWLISDFYLLKDSPDESYAWAMKAHELMKERPYDESHRAMMGRALRCGHFEGLQTILEFQKTHPVVVDYIKGFYISPDEENVAEKFLQQLNEYLPDAPDYRIQERQIFTNYKQLPMPIHLVLQYYHKDWGRLLEFAHKYKLRLGIGTTQRRETEEAWVNGDVVIDAETLVIMAFCDCLPALEVVDHIHISYSSVIMLQDFYLSNQTGYVAINNLMRWLSSTPSIVLEADGMTDADDILIQALPTDFFTSCNIATKYDIPFICADALMISLQAIPAFPIPKGIKFITIPSLCNVLKKTQPILGNQMIYNLLKKGRFISFSPDTIIDQIRVNNFCVSQELLQPFLICKTDYDMSSFARVYLQAASYLIKENTTAAEEFLVLLLEDTMRVWRRGTYYRESSIRFNDNAAAMRAKSITLYTVAMVTGTKSICENMSPRLMDLCHNLQNKVDEWHINQNW